MGKLWKKILFIILIVACLFNIVSKLVKKNSLQLELQSTVDYLLNKENNAVIEDDENN